MRRVSNEPRQVRKEAAVSLFIHVLAESVLELTVFD